MINTHTPPQLTISKENPFTTYIQTLSTSFEHQQAVIDEVSQLNQALVSQGGFVAVTLLRSLDGQRVVNYMQWEQEQGLFTALHSPSVQSTLTSLEAFISENQSRVYDVVYTSHALQNDVTTLGVGEGVVAINDVAITAGNQEGTTQFMIETDSFALAMPSHRSTTIHRSRDRQRNLNLIQFDNLEEMTRGLQKTMETIIQRNPQASFEGVEGLGTIDIHIYDIVSVFHC